MAEMALAVEEKGFDFIDINMGCPVHKVVSNGEGSALMKNPKKAYEIVSACVSSTDKPVTVKIRKGFDDEHINACEIALAAEAAGAAAVAVHARTRQQFYSGRADWSVIADVKRAVKIPVIGNGDITCAADVSKMYETTGCDGFMIGRAAQGNPWIFSDIISELEDAKFLQNDSDAPSSCDVVSNKPAQKRRSFDEMRKMLLLHARMEVDDQGERVGIQRMRKHMAWYTAGYPNSAKLRGRLAQINTKWDLEAILDIDEGK